MNLSSLKSSCLFVLCAAAILLASCSKNGLSPIAITKEASVISGSEVTVSASVNARNQVTSVLFEFGVSEKYGQSENADPLMLGADKEIEVSATLRNLKSDVKYHYRVRAENLCGVTFGKDRTFVPTSDSEILFNKDIIYGTLSDRENNEYKTVKIGSQIWMAENLKTTIFNDGRSITYIPDDNAWQKLESPGYSWYKDDPGIYNYKKIYGALYNFYAVQNGKLCPFGWHIPSEQEWYKLFDYLGGVGVCAGKLKETGTTHWMTPNTGATNESGFTALPGGMHALKATGIGAATCWWNAFELIPGSSIRVTGLSFDDSYISILLPAQNHGCSVRCLKD